MVYDAPVTERASKRVFGEPGRVVVGHQSESGGGVVIHGRAVTVRVENAVRPARRVPPRREADLTGTAAARPQIGNARSAGKHAVA
jgi:hypothetical protein